MVLTIVLKSKFYNKNKSQKMIHQGKEHHQGERNHVLILEKANTKVVTDVSHIGCWIESLPHRKRRSSSARSIEFLDGAQATVSVSDLK